MIVRTRRPINNGIVLDEDSEGYYYLKIPIAPDMPFEIPDVEIISP